LDENGTLVPRADNLVNFKISGEGRIIGVDNGLQTSHEPFQANYRKAFNGLCLAVIQSGEKTGQIELKASSEGLEESTIIIITK
jgi:beta-galactosidase